MQVIYRIILHASGCVDSLTHVSLKAILLVFLLSLQAENIYSVGKKNHYSAPDISLDHHLLPVAIIEPMYLF